MNHGSCFPAPRRRHIYLYIQQYSYPIPPYFPIKFISISISATLRAEDLPSRFNISEFEWTSLVKVFLTLVGEPLSPMIAGSMFRSSNVFMVTSFSNAWLIPITLIYLGLAIVLNVVMTQGRGHSRTS